MSTSQWHLKKEVNVSHMIGTIAIVVTMLSWANKMDNRVTVLEIQQVGTHEQLVEINKKLDRIVEWQINQ